VVQNLIQFEFAGDNHLAASVVALLNQHRFHVCWMREAEADLEEVFIRVTGRATRPAEGSAT
jgi:hypothetical protein